MTQTQQTNNEGHPCPGETHARCGISQPSGPGTVTIDVKDDGESTAVSVRQGGQTTNHNAVGFHSSQEEVKTTESWREAVNDAADNADTTVIFAANGNQSEEEQLNRQRIEQELWDNGRPYTVCFEDTTYTKSDGTVVTVPGGDCVTITPK